MKIETKISEITHEDLVNLFSTAFYGSNHFAIDYNNEDYDGKPFAKDDDCFEDKLAKIVLNGGKIIVSDLYAEDSDEHYGEIEHTWNEEEESMDYTITLKDIENGLAKAASSSEPYFHKCFSNFAENDCVDFDLNDADNLMQIIVFGEVIYG